MKARQIILKIFAIISSVACVIFGAFVEFNFRVTDGKTSFWGEGWNIFKETSNVDKTSLAMYGIKYDDSLKMLAKVVFVVLIVAVIAFVVLTICDLATKHSNQTFCKTSNYLSIINGLLGIILLIILVCYTGANTNLEKYLTSGVVITNVVMLVFSTLFSVATPVLHIFGNVKPTQAIESSDQQEQKDDVKSTVNTNEDV